mmetsp:Transcript_3000/g.4584  ORF Transcript_3000/g.4584 Transcript_3000/m.4584 type:complete len:150 (-) Transcript_3000:772-1221(-)
MIFVLINTQRPIPPTQNNPHNHSNINSMSSQDYLSIDPNLSINLKLPSSRSLCWPAINNENSNNSNIHRALSTPTPSMSRPRHEPQAGRPAVSRQHQRKNVLRHFRRRHRRQRLTSPTRPAPRRSLLAITPDGSPPLQRMLMLSNFGGS